MTRGATVESLRARHDAITQQYHEHLPLVHQVQNDCLDELVASLSAEFDLSDEAIKAAKAFLNDPYVRLTLARPPIACADTVFRFCRRARFSAPAAYKLLQATLSYRLSSSFTSLSLHSIDPIYLETPLFFFHPSLRDRFGRPCGVLNLRRVTRTEDGQLDELKNFVKFGWEVARKWLTALSKEADRQEEEGKDQVMLQIVMIVDLEGAGMANLVRNKSASLPRRLLFQDSCRASAVVPQEVELLPFFMDMLKQHFPSMVGAIFVLNYGWMYAGMWQLAKRVLPNTALERILFPTKTDLLEFFDEDHLLIEHGGKVDYEYTPANPIFTTYSPTPLPPALRSAPNSPRTSAYPSPSPSPSPSSSTLHSDVFQSATNSRAATPGHSRRSSTNENLSIRAPRNMLMTPASPLQKASLELFSHTQASSPSSATSPLPGVQLLPASPITSATPLTSEQTVTPTKSRLRGFALPIPTLWRRSPRASPTAAAHDPLAVDTSPGEAVGHTRHEATGLDSGALTPTTVASGAAGALRRVTSFADLQERLAATQAAIQSDDSGSEADDIPEETSFREEGTEGPETVLSSGGTSLVDEEGDGAGREGEEGASRIGSTVTSARSSRFSSRATSRDVSPSRRHMHLHTSRLSSARLGGSQTDLSPYNLSNPYYGYPAVVPSRSVDPTKVPRPHHERRRKRDLVRTLTYLAALRFLSLHRNLKARIEFVVRVLLRLVTLRNPRVAQTRMAMKERTLESSTSSKAATAATITREGHVHFADSSLDTSKASTLRGNPNRSSSSTPTRISSVGKSPSVRFAVPHHPAFDSLSHLDRYIYAFLLFIVLRTPSRREKLRLGITRVMYNTPLIVAKTVTFSGQGKKREWVRGVVGGVGERMVDWARKEV
ncbi:BZ3500_MvSof-1268-A1-R1_Chr5-3g08271 [Microbotryum saponariae]|uniref:BZ3500_MvSof-1268-A1-R1_Chr5-3g08271 protein n=1 Tax=Microbotryum saponariae TaxID=289078 RepID=A0A2X0KH95_9BASI|nr:BZ3500_MvSof-1268-A1-R1_Chr5-3g08271 [Microbotryum saponariae]SDA08379.1 BZ3501_MvSof-1269-A2-R1_Chr5-3g07999 [Microbotryum saponariae]